MCEDKQKQGRPGHISGKIITSILGHATIWRMRTECGTPKPTDTLSEYLTRTAFSLRQWLHIRVPVLIHTDIARLVHSTLHSLNYKKT